MKALSYDYIRGLVDGEGCFTFCINTRVNKDGWIKKSKVPAFSIAMHERDEDLINNIRDTLKLNNKVYNYKNDQKDGHKRGRKAVLIVRDLGQLKNIIIPFFYNKLFGHKSKQFDNWLEVIGSDSDVPDSFKVLYRLHKSGFYANNPRYL